MSPPKHGQFLVALASTILLGASARAQQLPPVRQLGAPLAVTHDSLTNVWNVRQLSDGRVLVNDALRHQLLIFDSTLSHPVVVIDSTPTTNRAYGTTYGGLIPYVADSTIFVDPVALALLVLDPAGHITRVLSPPQPANVGSLVAAPGGAAFDAQGRLVYRPVGATFSAGARGYSMTLYAPNPPAANAGASASNVPTYALHDSVPIIAGSLTTRAIDTVGYLFVPYRQTSAATTASDGSVTRTAPIRPIAVFDDWAVLSDGSIAFVRGRDYHIDWINTDGTHTSTPPVAHEWHRLSDSEKTAIVDSIRRGNDSAAAALAIGIAKQDSADKANGHQPVTRMRFVYEYPSNEEIPDYFPPFATLATTAVRADADDNLWIRQGYAAAFSGGPPPIYDIVNRQGKLVDRVQLPPSMAVAGFGPGVVYLTVREGLGTVLAKYRIH